MTTRLLAVVAATLAALSPLVAAVPGGAARGSAVGVAVYRGVGVPLLVEVAVSPGSGNVSLVGARGDDLFRLSVREALFEAAWVLGLSPWSLDYTVTITPLGRINTYFSGPSLSLAVYVAALSALTGAAAWSSAVYTGTLNPDSTVGFVGNVYEKGVAAAEHGYRVFVYPALQDREYRLEERVVHAGPYVFTVKEVVEEPGAAGNVTGVALLEADSAPALFLLVSNQSAPALAGRAAIYVSTREALGDLSGLVERYLSDVEARVADTVNETLRLLADTSLAVRRPGLYADVEGRLRTALAHLDSYRRVARDDLLLAASPYLFEAYGEALTALYTIRLLALSRGSDFYRAYMDAASSFIAVQKLLNLTRTASPAGAVLAARAAALLGDAARDYYPALLGMQGIISGLADTPLLRLTIAEELGRAAARLAEAKLYALLALSLRGGQADWGAAERFRDYVDGLYWYGRYYSYRTNVFSDILLEAGWYRRLALAPPVIDGWIARLASLGYAVESAAYTQLYFALHPGVRNTTDVRYKALLDALGAYLANAGPGAYIVAQWALERAQLYDDNASRMLWLEKALAAVKLYLALGGGGAVSTLPQLAQTSDTVEIVRAGEAEWPLYVAVAAPILLVAALRLLKPLSSRLRRHSPAG